jgi:hypothetical protein
MVYFDFAIVKAKQIVMIFWGDLKFVARFSKSKYRHLIKFVFQMNKIFLVLVYYQVSGADWAELKSGLFPLFLINVEYQR